MGGSLVPSILLVEDDDQLRKAIALILTRDGFVVHEARNVREGSALFEANAETIGLAVLDMLLPGESGLDLAAELERRRPGMKILYISGCVESVAMESIMRHSPQSVLLKPFPLDRLVDSVRDLLAGGRGAGG